MDISSSERLYFDKYLNNLRQVELWVTSLPASFFGAALQKTPKPFIIFFFLPFQSQNEETPLFCRGELTRRVPRFFGGYPCTLHLLISEREDLS